MMADNLSYAKITPSFNLLILLKYNIQVIDNQNWEF